MINFRPFPFLIGEGRFSLGDEEMITDYLDSAFGEGTHHNTSKGTQVSYCCPFCDDRKERMFVNLDRKVFFCHNCEVTGSLVTLISDFTKITWKEALDVYREYEGYEVQLPDSIEEEVYSKLIKVPKIEVPKFVYPLPEEFILLENAKGRAGLNAINYLKSRGVTPKMAEKHYIGYCAEGDFANRIIMPDFEDYELIYWQARTWEPPPRVAELKKYYRKVMNPSLNDEQIADGVRPIDKSQVIGNIDSVIENRMGVLVEGKMDQYTVGDIGACMHGKHMSDEQFIKLVVNKDKIDCLVVCYDGDALKSAITTADRLYKHYDDVLVVKLPNDADPNSLGRKKILEFIRDAIPYSPMFSVKAKLRGWT